MNVKETKNRLAGTHVTQVESGNFYLVDRATNEPLYDELINDELLVPNGYFIALKDGETLEVKVGFGKVWSESISFAGSSAGPVTVTSDDITDATTVGKSVLTADTAAAARTAIGAGTSNLVVGTGATNAKAGNYTPPNVTTAANGLMLATDKVKLDGVAPGATALTIGTTATTAMAGNTTIPAAVAPSTTAPAALAAAAAVGTGTTYARADHVHPFPSAANVGAAPATHNHPTSQVNLLTGYALGVVVTPLAATDTLNAALSKLEARILALETP